jgi:hypothetical protein
MLALDDGAIARLLIAASRFPLSADRIRFLEKFVAEAERRPPEQVVQMDQLPSGASGETNVSGENRPRSPDAARMRMRQHRARVRRGVAVVSVEISGAIINYLVREGLLRGDRQYHERAEIGAAITAALDSAARER